MTGINTGMLKSTSASSSDELQTDDNEIPIEKGNQLCYSLYS